MIHPSTNAFDYSIISHPQFPIIIFTQTLVMAAFHQTTGITPLCLDTEEDVATLERLLMTPFEQVYKLSPDGKTYVEPRLLLGTPVQRINESHEY